MELDFFAIRRGEFMAAIEAINKKTNVISIALQYFGLGKWYVIGLEHNSLDALHKYGLDKGTWVFTANYGDANAVAKRLDQELRLALILQGLGRAN